ncbi:3-hydroxyisobutyrate dehydrogenase-like beta-hydroxyacid dehydrogenase [Nocardia fluminea]|uniref:3-hydroxyisobutyrate dehydrogenase-like beta-hydroxyacid dehydrogenase n=1 Tax=Nocardia fluminea TaxID=134984 RepID=A0A2N3VKR1_9NOCA|nr:3-hydroxyisobutyrate dehydrogenase-like beta-hydroxyacid dehydrogenase [Nocardia fluminea]
MTALRIGFVGVGRMGAPMVRRLVAAGHEVRALGRSGDARRRVSELGAEPVSFTAAVGTGAAAVVVCVFTDDQVRAVCLDTPLLASMPGGSVLIVHTTGSPRTAEDIAAQAAAHDIRVVDAPVSGGPPDIDAGTLTMFAGGTEDALARARPVLRCYGDPVLPVGPLGSGQRVKLVNNALFAAQLGLLTEAVRLASELGVDEATVLSALQHASGASRAAASVAAKGSVAAFHASVGEFIGKDVATVRTLAAELGATMGTLDAAINAQFFDTRRRS